MVLRIDFMANTFSAPQFPAGQTQCLFFHKQTSFFQAHVPKDIKSHVFKIIPGAAYLLKQDFSQ